ncbi:SDR family oxidoreductase [Actinomadura rubrisoli]|uniref:SDR family oxidoreductase n=1 Tax=Actinomadura rubrisoli TaxID=2530368 RepID=UPI001FB7189F|nr:SDR family oxidoreductase [Actinomadura rubrisoli]
MLIVTGATGHLGSLIVNRLLERVPADRIAVSVREVPSASWSSPRPFEATAP